MPLTLTTPVFAILRGHIEDRVGLHFGESDRDVFLAKAGPRVEEAGFESFLDYYYYLRYDPGGDAELATLIEHLVVRETYLFREMDQLRTVVDRWIVPRVTRGETVRILSAACSTGEEPISLGILLGEAGVLDRVKLVASDISRHALDVARAGRYSRRALRALTGGQDYAPWLSRQTDGSVMVSPALIERVKWCRVNLIDRQEVLALGQFDLIFCRNALIYFSDETTRVVLSTLAGALRLGGALLVSVTESLMRYGTSLSCEEHDGVFFYRKVSP